MSTRAKQIECLNRLNDLTAFYLEIEEFLVGDRVATKDEFQIVKNSPMKGKELQLLLSKLSKNGKIQLLEYQWIILPVESITLTVVTDDAKREFTYANF